MTEEQLLEQEQAAGARLTAYIKSRGYSPADLAREMGVSRSAVSQILSGYPRIRTLRQIAEILGVTASELLAEALGEKKDFSAVIRRGGEVYCADSVESAKAILERMM